MFLWKQLRRLQQISHSLLSGKYFHNFQLSSATVTTVIANKMNSDNFEVSTVRTNQILSSENLQKLLTIRNNRNLLNENLPEEFQKISLDRQGVKFKEMKLESTEQVDIRVRKLNELNERFEKFSKNMKKPIKQQVKHCVKHRNVEPGDYSVQLNKITARDISVPDVDGILTTDEIIVQQHLSNIEKVSKLMETVKGYNYEEATLPAAEVVNNSISFLSETFSDVDYLNDSDTMYNGLSKESPVCAYADEIKNITDNLYMQ